MTKNKMLLAGFALIAFGSIAIGQGTGFWGNFPIIGGAAYCSSSNNNSCVNTVPAGPALTGNETFPVDTNASSMPATAKMKVSAAGIGPYTYNAPLTGAAVEVVANTRRLVLNPAGTIATLTVRLPPTPVDGQLFGLCTTQIVTALTILGAGTQTVKNAPTALLVPVATGAGSCVEWMYRTTDTSWYRTQ